MATATDILQHLHDSEINGRVAWFYGGQIDWAHSDDLNGVASDHEASIDDAAFSSAEA